ncbi:MAG: PhzF family phenazine biosynthesis protein [Bacteroidales bacterium]|nr:PhzF family phenazine biosynthesis protein [Bacteroidales bacterium]
MTTAKKIYQVDAFTTEPFRGNPAGVCILEQDMPEEWMQNVGAEMNLSETAFVVSGGPSYKIRYFSPEMEIPLCGHATLSAAHILYETAAAAPEKEIRFLSRAGELIVRKDGDWITMNFPAYKLDRIEIPEILTKVLGTRPEEVYMTGHGWTFVLLREEKEIRSLNPDFRLMIRSGFGDMIVTSPSDDRKYDFCVRCFAPALGINEDPVTGSAHCALVPFWHSRTGRREFVSHQVSRREGILKVTYMEERVEISGQARTIITGELFV